MPVDGLRQPVGIFAQRTKGSAFCKGVRNRKKLEQQYENEI
jgi:hypothetical protein